MTYDPAYWLFFMGCALFSAIVGYGAGVAQERIDRAAKFRAIADDIAERRRLNMRRHSSPQIPKFLTR